MPFYDFKCDKCGFIFEEFQNINDDQIDKCPKCSGTVKQLISLSSGQVIRNAKETYEIIKEEARQIREDIQNGDEELASDILGEEGMKEYYGIE